MRFVGHSEFSFLSIDFGDSGVSTFRIGSHTLPPIIHEPSVKNEGVSNRILTFQIAGHVHQNHHVWEKGLGCYTGWLIVILIMVGINPHITRIKSHPLTSMAT